MGSCTKQDFQNSLSRKEDSFVTMHTKNLHSMIVQLLCHVHKDVKLVPTLQILTAGISIGRSANKSHETLLQETFRKRTKWYILV